MNLWDLERTWENISVAQQATLVTWGEVNPTASRGVRERGACSAYSDTNTECVHMYAKRSRWGDLILAQGACEQDGKATPLTNVANHHLLFYLPNSYWAPTILCKNKTLGLGLGNSGSRVSSQSTSYIRGQTYRKPMVGMGWKWSEGPWWSTWKPALPKTKGISIGIMTAVLLFSLPPSPFLRHDYQDSVCLQLDY